MECFWKTLVVSVDLEDACFVIHCALKCCGTVKASKSKRKKDFNYRRDDWILSQ